MARYGNITGFARNTVGTGIPNITVSCKDHYGTYFSAQTNSKGIWALNNVGYGVVAFTDVGTGYITTTISKYVPADGTTTYNANFTLQYAGAGPEAPAGSNTSLPAGVYCIELNRTDITSLICAVSSNESYLVPITAQNPQIVWSPYTYSSYDENYTYDDTSIYADITADSREGFPAIWTTIYPASALQITALEPTETYKIVGSFTNSYQTCSIEYDFRPYRVVYTISRGSYTSKNIAVSASFYDPENNEVSINSLRSAPGTYITWDIHPTTYIEGILEDDSTYLFNGETLDPLTGTYIRLSASEHVSNKFTYSLSCNIIDELEAIRTILPFTFDTNYGIHYDVIDNTPNSITVKSFYDRSELQDLSASETLQWKVWPTSGISISALSGDNAYINLDSGWISAAPAEYIGQMHIVATDYDETYYITVSSKYGEWTNDILFEPYITLTEDSKLVPVVTQTDNTTQTRKYNLKVYGYSYKPDGSEMTRHNLSLAQQLLFKNNSVNEGLVAYYNNRTNVYDWYPTEDYLPSIEVNPLALDITTVLCSSTPAISSYSIEVIGLSTNYVEDGTVYTSTPWSTSININVLEWFDDAFFYPKVRINYTSDNETYMYRPSSTTNFIATISNTSIFPPNIERGSLIITIGNSAQTINYDTPSIPFEFESSTGPLCAISVTALNIFAPNWPDEITKVGSLKYIRFVDRIPTAFMQVFPVSAWNPTTDRFNEITNPLTQMVAVSAWGFCHTQDFSANQNSLFTTHPNDLFYWYIGGHEPYPVISSSTKTKIPIRSSSETVIYPITLRIFNAQLSSDMPAICSSDTENITGYYANYDNTEIISPAGSRGPITMYSFNGTGYAIITSQDGQESPMQMYIGTTAESISLSARIKFPDYLPVRLNDNSSVVWEISTDGWSMSNIDLDSEYNFTLKSNDVGQIGHILKYEPTRISVKLTPQASFTSKVDGVNDWCNSMISFDSDIVELTAYPIEPLIYTANKYILSGQYVAFENLVPEFDSIVYRWEDRDNYRITTSNSPYTTSYNNKGNYSISLQTDYVSISNVRTVPYIVTVYPEYILYNTYITRILNQTNLVLPHQLIDVEIAPNEWIIYDNINAIFDKLQDNLVYLDNNTRFYNDPPTELYGWFGSLNTSQGNRLHWHVNIPGIDYAYNNYLSAEPGPFSSFRDCCVSQVTGVGQSIMFVSDTTGVHILSSDFFATEISEISYKGIGDDFIDIVAVDTDADNRIYILDSPKNRVLVYSYDFSNNFWKLLYDWGGLGGPNAISKFYNPNDLYVDASNNIWIADTNNKVVKKYTKTGSWLLTIKSVYFSDSEKPLSMAVNDAEDEVHVLTTNNIVVFDPTTGEYIKRYPILSQLSSSAELLKIEDCKDGGFFYILTKNRVLKILQDNGNIVGNFAVENRLNYVNIKHDAFRNLYLISNNCIIKYIDKLMLFDVKMEYSTYQWPMSAIYVEADEYNQDWVLNRSFARMWDNIEIFRRSINGKPGSIVENGITVPFVKTFAPDEYKILPYNKENIYIGMNEFVSSPVINRCVSKLYDCQETILDMISE